MKENKNAIAINTIDAFSVRIPYRHFGGNLRRQAMDTSIPRPRAIAVRPQNVGNSFTLFFLSWQSGTCLAHVSPLSSWNFLWRHGLTRPRITSRGQPSVIANTFE